MFLNRKKEELGIRGPVKLISPLWSIFRFKVRKRSELEDVSKRVENHDWEHGENWKSIKRQAHQIFHTHQAVTMIAKLLLKRAPDVD